MFGAAQRLLQRLALPRIGSYATSKATRVSIKLKIRAKPRFALTGHTSEPLLHQVLGARRPFGHPFFEILDQQIMADRRGGPRLAIGARTGIERPIDERLVFEVL